MEFQVGKLYLTRNKKIRRVVCIDAPGEYPIISVSDNDDPVTTHKPNGRVDLAMTDEDENDLVLEYTPPRGWWILGTTSGPVIKSGPYLEPGVTVHVREVIEGEP
jgi:hypothetical protein